MQATATTRRFDPGQIKKAALAIGLLASMAIGATTASIVRDSSDASSSTASETRAVPAVHEQHGYLFREQNFNLPTAGAVRTANNHNYAFMEQNLYLPGDATQPATLSYDDIRYREMNELPESIAPAAANWLVIEQNSWGEDFVFDTSSGDTLPPSPNDVPQRTAGEIHY